MNKIEKGVRSSPEAALSVSKGAPRVPAGVPTEGFYTWVETKIGPDGKTRQILHRSRTAPEGAMRARRLRLHEMRLEMMKPSGGQASDPAAGYRAKVLRLQELMLRDAEDGAQARLHQLREQLRQFGRR
jgi:hypothetical protein